MFSLAIWLLGVAGSDLPQREQRVGEVFELLYQWGVDAYETHVPESFKVLVEELRSLGLALEVINEKEAKIISADEVIEEVPKEPREEIPRLEAEPQITEESESSQREVTEEDAGN